MFVPKNPMPVTREYVEHTVQWYRMLSMVSTAMLEVLETEKVKFGDFQEGLARADEYIAEYRACQHDYDKAVELLEELLSWDDWIYVELFVVLERCGLSEQRIKDVYEQHAAKLGF